MNSWQNSSFNDEHLRRVTIGALVIGSGLPNKVDA